LTQVSDRTIDLLYSQTKDWLQSPDAVVIVPDLWVDMIT